MALVRQNYAKDMAREAIVLDLGDLRRQGESIVAGATQRAEKIVRDAQAERDRLISGADKLGFEKGYARGQEEGLQAGQKQGAAAAAATQGEALTKLNAGWLAALARFDQSRERMLAEAQRDVVKLASMIAARVVKRQVELDTSIVTAQVAEVLAMVLRPTRLRLSVNPADRETIELAMPSLASRFEAARNMEMVDDAAVPRGSCMAQLAESGATIDARVATQLDRITEALLPGVKGLPDAGASGGVDAGGGGA